MTWTPSPALIALVKRFEGRARDNGDGTVTAYWDFDGQVWTIGYGTTGPEVTKGTVWTYAQCDAALLAKLNTAHSELCALSPVTGWPPGAEDALSDFVYNEGSGHYEGSTVRKCAQAGDWAGVKTHLKDWDYAGGKPRPGLLARRTEEGAMIQWPSPS